MLYSEVLPRRHQQVVESLNANGDLLNCPYTTAYFCKMGVMNFCYGCYQLMIRLQKTMSHMFFGSQVPSCIGIVPHLAHVMINAYAPPPPCDMPTYLLKVFIHCCLMPDSSDICWRGYSNGRFREDKSSRGWSC